MEKSLQYPQEPPLLGSLLEKDKDLKAYNFIKKRPQHNCFLVNIVKIFKNNFFIEHLQWLLLTVLLKYVKVNWNVSSLIQCLHVLSILIRNLSIAQIILYYHATKHFLLLLELIVHVLPISEYVLEKH